MNYNIIANEGLLHAFIDWLPALEPHEKYYLCLFARNKYTRDDLGPTFAHIKSDKQQLKRFVSDKERMYDKIKQLEVEFGAYKSSGLIIPQEALALYITVNPRNMFKATVNTMVKLAQSIRDNNVIMNPHQEAMSEIQKSKSRTCYVDFDVDSKEMTATQIARSIETVGGVSTKFYILESRGGYHILVDPSSIDPTLKNSWYMSLKLQLRDADQIGDLMIPVIGSYQGGFIPNFKTYDNAINS